ncbi:MAG TPA: DUF4295 family protein [Candidatus Marinimicrobia bacterium]|nr:DUF4295 family protein [Candidatus Neomarinimicrobiota bacterium]
MAKKQTSFADKAAKHRGKGGDAVYAKYIKSVRSEKTGQWRFNEKMIRMDKGEALDAALKRMDEAANLVDIDLSQFAVDAIETESVEPDESPATEDIASSEGEQSEKVLVKNADEKAEVMTAETVEDGETEAAAEESVDSEETTGDTEEE